MKRERILLKDITKSYYSETAVTQALRKISLTLCEGEFVAITGESGSGKSTLLNIIGGMDTFDDGEMFVDGSSTSQFDDADWEDYRRNKIGYVFQDYSLVSHYTALDNVMSALLIMEKDVEESTDIAMSYLQKVGLEGLESHKASELSSGQKQRLSIARALAKGTGIIVADEPTGNLDTETGDQIIRLLKELSNECLVIMVTHNYDQVEPFATRKIRLHDGEVISDVSGVSSENADEAEAARDDSAALQDREEDAKSRIPAQGRERGPQPSQGERESRQLARYRQNRTAAYFARLNRRTQKGRAVLFTSFLLIVSAVSFLFIGELYEHADDIHTRAYDQSAFYKEDDTRIVVKREDGAAITDDDLAVFRKIPHVTTVDSCDFANDICYHLKEDVDYKYNYGIIRNWSGTIQTVSVEFLKDDQFVLSTDCIEESGLSSGRMPESRNEIVLYSRDESVLNTTVTCYFTSTNLWGHEHYYKVDLTICGLLRDETDQVYFSRELCRMISTHADSDSFRLLYNWEPRVQVYASDEEFVPVVADDLVGNQVRLSEKLEDRPYWDTLFRLAYHDSDGREMAGFREQVVSVLDVDHDSTSRFMEVSQEFYDRYYQWKGTQASLYIANYAKTDQVLRDLETMGYEGVSASRVSSGDYIQELVDNRLTIIGICTGGLIGLFAAAVLILRSLMKIRVKDYFILKFIGMRLQMIGRISYYELIVYSLCAMFLTIVFMWLLRYARISVLMELMWYMRWDAYLLFAGYNLLLWAVTAASFNHLLRGRLKS